MSRVGHRGRGPLAEARAALDEIGVEIEYDKMVGASSGEDIVLVGLDHMASALIDLAEADIDGVSLDAVLAELGQRDEVVERAAGLIQVLGRMSYDQLSEEDAREAEELRVLLYDDLDTLIETLAKERSHA